MRLNRAVFQKWVGGLCAAFALTVAATAVGLLGPDTASAQTNARSESRFSAIVVDASSGEVLYGLRADSPRYPASITKVMTLYLAFEALSTGEMSLTDEITMSRHAASMQPTKLGLRAGQTITVADAINAIGIRSANDIAVAMAEHLGGTESRFGAMMTLRAHQLGMHNTRFVNASGLPDPRQISTARDLAILSQAVMRDFPQYYGMFSQTHFFYNGNRINGHNNLLHMMEGADGLKTGYTNASGYNLASSAVQDGTRLITVVLGGTSNPQRDNEVARLLRVGFTIADRRANGEVLAETQNLFVPFEYARVEQPAAEIELASAQGDSTDAPVASGNYAVQVGAFRQRSQAENQVNSVGNRFANLFSGAEREVGDRVGGFFRARFSGLSAEAARSACSALQASAIGCLVIAP